RADHVDCVLAPLVTKKTIAVTGLPDNTMRRETPECTTTPKNPSTPKNEHALTVKEATSPSNTSLQIPRSHDSLLVDSPIQPPHDSSLGKPEAKNESAITIGHCKRCGGSLRHVDNVIACDCGVVYKLPAGADLTDRKCTCGLPKFKLKLLGIDVCVDRQCENMDAIIAAAFVTRKFTCPRCGGPLTVVRRKGLIVGCERYYDGCKTAFLLPSNATITGRCTCGLPRLQLKTKARCLDTSCRA
ncbi:MAG: hypothetical protein ACXV45_04345, partial [Halobacteriota archaeon]